MRTARNRPSLQCRRRRCSLGSVLNRGFPTARARRVDDRRVLNGIFYVVRTGCPWRDLPERYGPYTTCYNRYNR